ncbi:MFS general substrate transporter [Myriangium duriaei CBS 260.36]|uniref:MFS general substrate transporter n=1 Tax=Myriangium duriaei CBS 260.36 TaxID=1168546 RepID=A0A9P4IS34_9PEZI|nr:MFS general substrate transporter [Myriangium duriaei CBS 260.36]
MNQSSGTLRQAIREHKKVVWYCAALTSAIILYGYDFVIVSTASAQPVFQDNFGTIEDDIPIIPAVWLALWSAASPIGTMFGACICGPLQDRFGRRTSMATGSVIAGLAALLLFFSDTPDTKDERRSLFLVGEWLIGIGIGNVMCTTQTYMSEVLPTKLRGPVLAFLPIFMLVGQLLGAVIQYACSYIDSNNSYRIPFASQWIFTAFPLILSICLPESPIWLVRQYRMADAVKARSRLVTNTSTVEADIEQLRIDILAEQQGGEHATYSQCFRGSDLRRTLIVCFTSTVPSLFGLDLLSNASYFLEIVGFDDDLAFIFVIIGVVVGIIANVSSVWTLDHFGRRSLSLVTLSVATVLWLSAGIASCFDTPVVEWWVAVSLVLIVISCGLGAWPASFVISSETSSLHLRSLTQGISWMFSGLFSGIFSVSLPYIYNPDSGDLGGKTCFIYFGWGLIAVAITWLFIPEMRDRDANEIDVMFKQGLATRNFKKWQQVNDEESKDSTHNEASQQDTPNAHSMA